YIRAAQNGEPLAYANIVVLGSDYGAAADVQGYYVIPNLPAGTYTLKVMMLGYQSAEKEVEIKNRSDLRFDFELPVEALQTETVTVTAERTRFENKVEVSRVNLSSLEIKRAPAFIEADLFRSLQLLPGISAQNDFSSALIVRGGSPDENLILLDGTEVYNPYHIGGIFSTFNSDAISDAEFLAGGFPAEYGGRISSVLNITTKEGNSREGFITNKTPLAPYWDMSHIKGEINILSSKILAEGPIYKGSWIYSYRRTYFDKVAQIYYWTKDEPQNWIYFFQDAQFKLISDLSHQHRLTFSSYGGNDQLNFILGENTAFKIDFDWIWGNNTSSLNWRWVPNSKFFNNLSIAKTKYDFDVNLVFTSIDSIAGEASDQIIVKNTISDWTIKEKLDWYLSEAHTISLGMTYKTLGMSFNQKFGNITFFDQEQEPHIIDGFIQDKWQINPLFSVQPGLRLSKYELHKKLYLQPRLGLKYRLTENFTLKGSWGIYNQFLFTTNDEENEILRVVDFWEPIPKHMPAQENQHFIAGIEKWFGEGFTGSIELYYKPYKTALDLNPANNPGDDSDDFIAGTGEASGIELLLKKTGGDLTGWIGYSYSNVTKKIDFNGDGFILREDGEIFNPQYDRPHTVNIVASYSINQSNAFSLTISGSSGQPYTPILGKVFSQSNFGSLKNPYESLKNIEGLRNSARYPYYFRVDLGFVREQKLWNIDSKLKFQIINLTNHYNVLLYQWDHDRSPSKVTAFSMFPIVPSFGWEFEL
ncbi:MAG TPA: TonB-dependent receptor, partial [Candidatus Marinimicrobia bacterium]|nr:TonB-dependent receptor [Candidatus Neomarinimicrobiota bacterium]